MKVIVGIWSVILGISLVVGWFYMQTKDVQVTYLLPEELEGCVSVHFYRTGEKELDIEDGELLIRVPSSGTVFTSSPSTILTDLGWHEEKAFYVNEQGDRVQEIDSKKITSGVMSSTGSPSSEKFIRSFNGPNNLCQ